MKLMRILPAIVLMLLSACASIPAELTGGPFSLTTPQQAQIENHDGEPVRWGGIIIQTSPQAEQTCFEVMALSLDSRAAPEADDHSLGRFIACIPGFYDPALYAAGRAVTLIGQIDGSEQQKVGEYLYHFPRLAAEGLHLWPKPPKVVYVPYPDPFWDPFWPYYYRPYYHRR